MSNTNTGGPAFPHTVEYQGAGCAGVVPHGGMTLRDYFAAKALIATYMNGFAGPDAEHRARICYEMADAMLKAREQ